MYLLKSVNYRHTEIFLTSNYRLSKKSFGKGKNVKNYEIEKKKKFENPKKKKKKSKIEVRFENLKFEKLEF